MSSNLERARRLRDMRRYDEAIAALHQHLAGDPDDFDGHLQLALARFLQGESNQAALEDIQRAIALEPESLAAHGIRSEILNELKRHDEALESADRALQLDPESDYAWYCRGKALMSLRRLDEAEEATRKSLAIDPDDADVSNLLATILRLQGRLDESDGEVERQLARDPENAWTFATAGWTALNRGDRTKAEELFREALRLDAGLEHARVGLRESYKARSAVYRLYLKWVFFLNRHSEKNQWAIVIGIFIAYRFGRELLTAIHPLAAVPLVVAYLLFAFGAWLASGLGHFLLFKDPSTRLTLTRGEKYDGLLVGGLFFSGLLLLVAGVTILPTAFALLGGALMGAAVPGGLIFDNPSIKGRLVFGLVTSLVLVCGLLVFVFTMGKESGEKLLDDRAGPLLVLGVIAVMLTTWIGGASWLREKPAT